MSYCNMIRDLMPLCVDAAASRESRESVRSHLQICPDCAKFYHELRVSREAEKKLPPVPPYAPEWEYRILAKRIQRNRTRMVLTCAGVFAALTALYAARVLDSGEKNDPNEP